jgi:hypothetical protein
MPVLSKEENLLRDISLDIIKKSRTRRIGRLIDLTHDDKRKKNTRCSYAKVEREKVP